MPRHARDNSNNPQTINDTDWHCGCGFTTKDTDVMAAHVENCNGG
jgi:hypothetical protein